MKWFLISPFTINVLNVSILLIFMVYYLFRIKRKSEATRFLITFLIGVTLVFLSFIVVFSSIESFYATLAWWVVHLFTFASIAMVQFAYYFPVNIHPRESKIVFVITVVLSLFAYPYYIFRTLNMDPVYTFDGHHYVYSNMPEIGIVIGLEVLWMLIVFLRKATALSHFEYNGVLRRWAGVSGDSHRLIAPVRNVVRFVIACIKVYKSKDRSAAGIRKLLLVFVSPIVLIIAVIMAYEGFLSWEIFAHILGSGFMVMAFIFVTVYINNSSEPSTFMVKLIGISLGTMLIAAGLAANVALMIKEDEYNKKRLIETAQCKIAVSNNDFSLLPDSVVYILVRPFGKDTRPIDNKVLFTRDGNFSQQKIQESSLTNISTPKNDFLLQNPSETKRQYRKLSLLNSKSYYIHYDFSVGEKVYEVAYSYIDYRKAIHGTGLTLAYIIIGSALFIVGVFPLFFKESLLKPLERLLDGMRKVNDGDLGVVVPVQVEDEIGFLSGSFNNMVKSILDSEKKLKDSFDYQVKLTKSYSYFVPKEFLDYLKKKSIVDIRLGDNIQKEMTVLFSDIRSFTMLSEKMTPQENFNFLNSCLSRIGPVVRNSGGFIDKYIGDAIMALFPDSADDAIHSAIAMQNVIETYNRHRKSTGYDSVKIGIGIHTGMLMLGTIGEEKRMEGTVISDAVNLASRLEGLTKLYGASVIVSNHTLKSTKDQSAFSFRYLGRVLVKGKRQWVDIYEILDGNSEDNLELKLKTRKDFEQGIVLYKKSEFIESEASFNKVLEENPDDKAADLYIKRCRNLHEYGVPDDWEGVTAFTEK